MELVGSRAGDDDDLRAGALAVLGSVGVAQDVEFLDGLDAEQLLAGAAGLHVVLRGSGELDAIEQEEILLRAVAGDGEIVAGGGVGDADAAGLLRSEIDDAGIEGEQEIVAAAVQGQVAYLLLADEAGDVLGRGVHDRNIFGDGDLLLNLAHLEGEVSGRVLADDEGDSDTDPFREAVFSGVDFVVSDGELEQLILSGLVGKGGARASGVGVDSSHGCGRDGGTGGIGDSSGQIR